MVEGESGLIATAPAHFRPQYFPSLRKVEWPNGAVALLFSSDEPDRLRGPQCDTLWVDELCAMRLPQDTLDMAMLGLRLGVDPRCLITTTPRPIKTFRDLLARDGKDVAVTRSSTFANAANLAKPFLESIVRKYEGTRIGQQELEARVLDDVVGALWSHEILDRHRVKEAPATLKRVVVALDPATTSGEDADETGIVVVGVGEDGAAYVLDDRSGRYSPTDWARAAIAAFRRHRADLIVGESNQGGEMVEATLRAVDANVPIKLVHASRGKITRAEPVSALYERGLVHHVGVFADLETQMTAFTVDQVRSRGSSPDRVDALVWGLTECALDGGEPGIIGYYARTLARDGRLPTTPTAGAEKRAPFDNMVPGAAAKATAPTVRLRAPSPAPSTLYTLTGQRVNVTDGVVELCEEDAAPMIANGWEKIAPRPVTSLP